MEIFPALFIQRDLFLLAVEIKCSQDTQRRVSWKEVNRSTSCQWWSAARLPGWICRWLRVRVKTLRMHVFFFQVEILENSTQKILEIDSTHTSSKFECLGLNSGFLLAKINTLRWNLKSCFHQRWVFQLQVGISFIGRLFTVVVKQSFLPSFM